VHALRAARFGPEAAGRLAELDAQRAAWAARVEDYRAARAALAADAALSPDAEAAAVEALLAARFSGPERTRVEALDRIAAGASVPTP
jgi:lipase chaperone LimK